MTEKKIPEGTLNQGDAKYIKPTDVGVARLYVDGHNERIQVVRVRVEVQLLQTGQYARPKREELLFLSVNEAESLARRLEAAVDRARARGKIGDH